MKNILTDSVKTCKKVLLSFSIFLLGGLFLYSQSTDINPTSNHGPKNKENPAVFVTRPGGWTEETHGKNAQCHYSLLFDDSKVQRIDIIIDPQVYKTMEEDVAQITMGSSIKPVYVPVTILYNGFTWQYVGMRYKGNSTLVKAREKGHKLPFRLDFDKFEKSHPEISDQCFYGFRKMTFSNNFFDASFLREKVCADIFRNGGVPAARGAFYTVFVDTGDGPLYWGLYTMIEDPSDRMIDNQFENTNGTVGTSRGNIYKPRGTGAAWSEFDSASFIKKTNKKASDFSDVRAAFDALHSSRTNPAHWRARLESVFNIHAFIRWLAINTAIVNWDSYGSMPQNYYLYQNKADKGRLVWFPWDLNMSMDIKSSPAGCLTLALNEVEEDWPLIRFIMDDPVYNKLYHQELIAALNGCMNEITLIPYIKKLHTMIRQYTVGREGEKKGYSYLTRGAVEFDQALQILIQHIKERNRAVRNYLNSR